ncbi:MAG: aldehyde dehydrogenase [Tannerellaceae bacterium]|jgi:aldehyde dehydrogenase (NAD+)|nr:aldehyde dehydrogenase [Tannerellaceae bacterium]
METDISGIERQLCAQRSYYHTGITRSINERLKLLRRLKTVLLSRLSEIEKALWEDLHKSSFEAYATEISIVLAEIELCLKNLPKWAKAGKVSTPLFLFSSKSRILKEPYGLVLIMAPWNYPFQLSLVPLVSAVAAGNVVALKPSEDAPCTFEVMKHILIEVFDSKHVSIFPGDMATSKELLKQRFDYIFFTGSPHTARVVMEAAAKNLTPITLELGGKSPCIVDKSATLKVAAKRIAFGKFINAGQTCIAPDYLLLHKDIAAAFLLELMQVIKDFYGENALKNEDYPRIISKKAMKRLACLLEGEEVVYGGAFVEEERYIEPTLIRCKSTDSPIMRSEIFGPLLPIIEMDSLNDALAYINKNPKPLALYYFGNERIGSEVIHKTSSGGACINNTILQVANPQLPFGGVGESGMGSYHGKAGFDTFTHHRSVLISKTWLDFDVKYPPYKGKLKWIRKIL